MRTYRFIGHQRGRYSVRKLCQVFGAEQSMSRQGNCDDDTQTESFWSRLTAELLDGSSFAGLEETRLEAAHHIATYNVP